MNYSEDFATWLETAYQESRFKSYAELGEAAGGLSRSTIASLSKAKPQTANNKASRPKRENVVAIATALNKDVDEALQIAGHSSTKTTYIPNSILKAINKHSHLTERDERLIVNFIELLAEEKQKEDVEIDVNTSERQEIPVLREGAGSSDRRNK